MLPRHCSRQVRKIAACKTGESVERDEDLRPDKCWPPNKVCALFLKKNNNKKHTAVTEMVNELLFYGAFQVTKHFTLQSMIHTHKKKKKITARSAHVRLIINNEGQNHRPSDC